MVEEAALARMKSKKASGKIGADVSDLQLHSSAKNEASLAQSIHILNAGLTNDQFVELSGSMKTIEHENGASWTGTYGNMRTYNGAGPAQQRARNTNLTNTREVVEASVDADLQRGINASLASLQSMKPPPAVAAAAGTSFYSSSYDDSPSSRGRSLLHQGRAMNMPPPPPSLKYHSKNDAVEEGNSIV